MTTVETIGRIRHAYFVQRQSVREIARRRLNDGRSWRRATCERTTGFDGMI